MRGGGVDGMSCEREEHETRILGSFMKMCSIRSRGCKGANKLKGGRKLVQEKRARE